MPQQLIFTNIHCQRVSKNPTASTALLLNWCFLISSMEPASLEEFLCRVWAQPSSTALSHLLPSQVDFWYWICHIIFPDFSASHRNNFFYLPCKLLHTLIIPFYLECLFWNALTWSCCPCSLQVRDLCCFHPIKSCPVLSRSFQTFCSGVSQLSDPSPFPPGSFLIRKSQK